VVLNTPGCEDPRFSDIPKSFLLSKKPESGRLRSNVGEENEKKGSFENGLIPPHSHLDTKIQYTVGKSEFETKQSLIRLRRTIKA